MVTLLLFDKVAVNQSKMIPFHNYLLMHIMSRLKDMHKIQLEVAELEFSRGLPLTTYLNKISRKKPVWLT